MSIQSFIEKICVQTAVYWGNPRNDGFGQKIYDSPVEISVRWDVDVQQVKGAATKNTTSGVTIMVTQDLDYGGLIMLGELSSLTHTQKLTPIAIDGVHEITGTKKVSMPKSTTQFVRTITISPRTQLNKSF